MTRPRTSSRAGRSLSRLSRSQTQRPVSRAPLCVADTNARGATLGERADTRRPPSAGVFLPWNAASMRSTSSRTTSYVTTACPAASTSSRIAWPLASVSAVRVSEKDSTATPARVAAASCAACGCGCGCGCEAMVKFKQWSALLDRGHASDVTGRRHHSSRPFPVTASPQLFFLKVESLACGAVYCAVVLLALRSSRCAPRAALLAPCCSRRVRTR